MRFVATLLSLLMTACSCATPSGSSHPANNETLTMNDPQDQVISLGEASIELDIDFDPKSKFKVGRVRFDLPVTGASAEELAGWIRAAETSGLDAVVIDLNTPGGSVSAGQRVAKVIEESPVPVYCVADGMAASMGMYLLQSCQFRLMTKRTVLMAHGPSVSGFVSGQDQDFHNISQMLKATEEALATHICKRINLLEKDCRSKFSNGREWWINAKEALSVEAVDYVTPGVQALVLELRKSMTIPVDSAD